MGNRSHQELSVPVEELDEFNRHLLGPIQVVASYYGEQFTGALNPETKLPVTLTEGEA